MKKHPANTAELAHLRNVTERIGKIPEEEWAFVVKHIYKQRYEESTFLVQAGEQVDSFFFITKGLVRFYYTTESGKEFNKHFAGESGYAGSYISVILGIPCPYSIEALEQTELLVLENRLLQELYNRHPFWERLGRVNAERLAILKEFREKEFLLDSAEVRYRRFLKEFPDLVDRIPQYHIASYLGITDVALSRIRKKMGNINPG